MYGRREPARGHPLSSTSDGAERGPREAGGTQLCPLPQHRLHLLQLPVSSTNVPPASPAFTCTGSRLGAQRSQPQGWTRPGQYISSPPGGGGGAGPCLPGCGKDQGVTYASSRAVSGRAAAEIEARRSPCLCLGRGRCGGREGDSWNAGSLGGPSAFLQRLPLKEPHCGAAVPLRAHLPWGRAPTLPTGALLSPGQTATHPVSFPPRRTLHTLMGVRTSRQPPTPRLPPPRPIVCAPGLPVSGHQGLCLACGCRVLILSKGVPRRHGHPALVSSLVFEVKNPSSMGP